MTGGIKKVMHLSPVPPEWGGVSMGGMANAIKEVAVRMAAGGTSVAVYAYNRVWNDPVKRYSRAGDVELIGRPSPEAAGALTLLRNYGMMNTMYCALHYPKVRREIRARGLPASYTKLALGEMAYLRHELTRYGPDIVHIHIPNKSTLALPFLRFKQPLVGTIHKHHHPLKNPDRPDSDTENSQRILAMALEAFDALIAVSQGVARELSEMGFPNEKLHVIPNGVDTSTFQPMDRERARIELGIPADARVVLYVGRLEKIKGLDALLEAWTEVRNEQTDALLYLVGDGSEREALERKARDTGVSDSVVFTGARDHSTLPLWYSAADVFCSPTLAEAFPLTFLEAMACGLPCVGPDIEGVNEAVRHGTNGLLYTPGKVEGLAAALNKILSSQSLLEKLSHGALDTARGYSWDSIVARILQVYDKARAEKR